MERKPSSGDGGLMEKQEFRTPYFLIDEKRLCRNLEILQKVQQQTGCKILLAQKAFSMFFSYPLLKKFLAGTTASGLYEARLGSEEFGGETHVFSPAYREDEFEELLQYADDIVFNTPGQVKNLGGGQKRQENRSDCGSIRSVPLRRDMKFMIRVHRDPVWERRFKILTRRF